MPHDTIEDFIGSKTIAVLRSVIGGTGVLVDPEDKSRDPKPISDVAALSTDDALLLANLILDVDSWDFVQKRCLTRNAALLRLKSPIGEAAVVIDVAGCQTWDLNVNGERQCGFFDPVIDSVRGILRRTFPGLTSSDLELWNEYRDEALSRSRKQGKRSH